jgi:hypothetical protein
MSPLRVALVRTRFMRVATCGSRSAHVHEVKSNVPSRSTAAISRVLLIWTATSAPSFKSMVNAPSGCRKYRSMGGVWVSAIGSGRDTIEKYGVRRVSRHRKWATGGRSSLLARISVRSRTACRHGPSPTELKALSDRSVDVTSAERYPKTVSDQTQPGRARSVVSSMHRTFLPSVGSRPLR